MSAVHFTVNFAIKSVFVGSVRTPTKGWGIPSGKSRDLIVVQPRNSAEAASSEQHSKVIKATPLIYCRFNA